MFVGRESEIRFLNHYYGLEGSHILVVYGQKGIGKTTLLKHFARDKHYFYYLGKACSDREQRYQWANEISNLTSKLPRYPSYGEILQTVLPDDQRSEKQILILDEFHHFIKGDGSFFDEITEFIKKRKEEIMILLCTSASGWVENTMISKLGSRAVSISGLLKVRELHYKEMTYIFPGYTAKDSIYVYSILGGVPGLWNSFNEELSARENIIENLINENSRLYHEASVYMYEQLREPAVYNTILAAISKGYQKLHDIHMHTGFSRAKISVYLKNLMEIDLVEKVFSIETEGYANTQKGMYRISNSFINFYFTYLFPNLKQRQELEGISFYNHFIENSLDDFVEIGYKKICKDYISAKYISIGEWIGKSGNLDIVAKSKQGHIIVAMCACTNKVTFEDYEWLLFQVKQAKLLPDEIIIFAESGCDKKIRELASKDRIVLQSILKLKDEHS